MQFFLYT